MNESTFWWLQYLRIFALNSPWGTPTKFTIGVTAYEGQQAAALWMMIRAAPNKWPSRGGLPTAKAIIGHLTWGHGGSVR